MLSPARLVWLKRVALSNRLLQLSKVVDVVDFIVMAQVGLRILSLLQKVQQKCHKLEFGLKPGFVNSENLSPMWDLLRCIFLVAGLFGSYFAILS
jgi:hypothetical protein